MPVVSPFPTSIEQFTGQYEFLSNFYSCPVLFQGITFSSSEQAYVWSKTLVPAEQAKILAENNPGKLKRYGRHEITLRPGYDDEFRLATMRAVVKAKYDSNPDLVELLLATDDAIIIEGNLWHDNFYGDCRCGRKPECKATGLNHLGKLHEYYRHVFQKAKGAL